MGKIFDKLRIQGRMPFFEKKKETECFKPRFDIVDELILLVFLLLKKVLSASSYGHFTAAKEFWSQCHIFRFGNDRRSTFGRIKLHFEPEKRSAGAFWADQIVF